MIYRQLALLAGLCAAPAAAQDVPHSLESSASEVGRDDIVVYGRAIRQVGNATAGSQGTVGYQDFRDRPVSRTGELVENVPGVIATQHSGTGKANQYFLRGFNLDHATDFAGFVDGAPINQRTHGHGQGYLDLNFLIPEVVTRIDYRKGPYFADVGDFSAAGTVMFSTAARLEAPIAEVTAGSYGYLRGVAAGSSRLGDGDLLVAVEGVRSSGPWDLDEQLRKANGFAKFTSGTAEHGWDLSLSAYHASWNATDQVPQRAVESGLISRFGNIDDTLGGNTTRIGLTGNLRLGDTRATLYAARYKLRLLSNFTYFLDDPVNGDQFAQYDDRWTMGGSLRHDIFTRVAGIPAKFEIGGDARYDALAASGLDRTVEGAVRESVRRDAVDEYGGALYATATAYPSRDVRLVLGLRGDLLGYAVRSKLLDANSGSGWDAIVTPKATLTWLASDRLEFYANYGESFHSNDVRGATITVDPQTGEPATPVDALVRARGEEIGMRLEAGRLTFSLVAFHLTLGSELVFSGDAGTTEPNLASRRYGAEATAFWRPADWLTLDAALALTHSRFRDAQQGESQIPNALGEVLSAGAAFQLRSDFSGSLRLRHMGAAPLIEDGSARSGPTTLLNAGLYRRWGRVRAGLELLNALDSDDDDITYYYASRLPGEPAGGSEDYHVHPVEPRQVRASMTFMF